MVQKYDDKHYSWLIAIIVAVLCAIFGYVLYRALGRGYGWGT